MTGASQFAPGFRLIDGSALDKALNNPLWSYDVIAATPGGSKNTSAKITSALIKVKTATIAGAGVTLPQALPGQICLLINSASNNIRVFADGNSTIDGISGIIGDLQDGLSAAMYLSMEVMEWIKLPWSTDISADAVTRRQLFKAMLASGIMDQVYQAVAVDSDAWIDFNSAESLLKTDPLGVLIGGLIGPTALDALWALAKGYPQ